MTRRHGVAFFLVGLLLIGGLACMTTQSMKVTLIVIPPADTPPEAVLYVAGNLPELGDWNPGNVALQRRSDSTWTMTIRVPKDFRLELKVTRGSWETEAVYEDGVIPVNTVVRVVGDTLMTLRPHSWKDQGMRPPDRIVGQVAYHRGLRGEGLNHARDVIVWLPPSYDAMPDRRFQVLYMHDGQNVFDPATSFIGYDWQVDEVADSLIRIGAIEEVIVVGIYNTPDRIAEYSDTPLGERYARFVVHRLKPMIDSVYRTAPGREQTAVMGSSMGGLISFLFTWWHPEVFSKAGCLSGVFDRSRTKAISLVSDQDRPPPDIKLYLDCGGAGGDKTLVDGVIHMARALSARGYQEGKDLVVFIDPEADHNERAWAGRVWRPLTFLFGKN